MRGIKRLSIWLIECFVCSEGLAGSENVARIFEKKRILGKDFTRRSEMLRPYRYGFGEGTVSLIE